MGHCKPHRLLKALLGWSAVTFAVFWLPTIRGLLDGPSYRWSSFHFSGSGVSGDYWFPLLASAGALAFLFLGWRGARQPFPWLLVGWHALLAAMAVRLAATEPESFRLRGDTLGIDVSLAWVGPVSVGGFALLAAWWAVRRAGVPVEAAIPPWNLRNWRLLQIALGMLPLQFLLLRSGAPDGTADQIGVLVTLVQWALLSAAFYPWDPTRRARRPTHDHAR